MHEYYTTYIHTKIHDSTSLVLYNNNIYPSVPAYEVGTLSVDVQSS